MANAFQKGLLEAMDRGNLRVADVARWFGRRHSTVRGWVVDGREPAGTTKDMIDLFARLNALQGFARKQRGVELRRTISSATRRPGACRSKSLS